jgi:hypothetical protein
MAPGMAGTSRIVTTGDAYAAAGVSGGFIVADPQIEAAVSA